VSIPRGAETDAEIGGEADYLEIEMQDANGTVAVLHGWPQTSADAVSTPTGTRLRSRLRLARAASDWAIAVVAIAASGLVGTGSTSLRYLSIALLAGTFPVAVALLGGYRSAENDDALAPVVAGLGATVFAAAVVDDLVSGAPSISADGLLVLASMLVSLEVVTHVVWSWIWRSPSVRRLTRLRTAVVGTPGGDEDLSEVLGSFDDLDPVAVIDGFDTGSSTRSGEDRLGAIVDRVFDTCGAECLLVVNGAVPRAELEDLRRVARLHDAEMRVVVAAPATFPGALRVRATSEGHAIVHLPQPKMTRGNLIVKRSMDLVVGAIAFVVALPIMLAIGIAIKLTSPGRALFTQERATKGGRIFRIVKFRTMETDAGREFEDTTSPFFKMADDPRLTRIGRWIRPLSLDELPQLWNVLRGEMSLVGPRPLPKEQVEAHPDLLGPRHDVATGMTGWWQVNGRSDLPAEEAVWFDRFYIENWSIGLDLRILAKTIGVLFKRRGAY
jgi:exopolysaccharide biosynthesis polyprenyl glycosylphosphotransferase